MVRVFVTGGAGFIGSHICDRILDLGHEVVCFDNLATGFKENIEHLRNNSRFTFIEGDIRNTELLDIHLPNCTHVCHQAALGSVPRSIENPRRTNEFNIVGSLNVLTKAQEHSIDRLVFASSSSVYGDNKDMPKVEDRTGDVLSPYAVTKSAFEDYARVFNHIHGMETIGLRYFNVFGPRQSPEGAYAAVIPLFMKALREGEKPKIFGDGEQTRDFTYVQNAVDANILSLFGDIPDAYGKSFNIACGNTLSINEVFNNIRESINLRLGSEHIEPIYAPPREGDIKDSLADLTEARRCLNYFPKVDFSEGIEYTVSWFIEEKK
jgi:nucleoside-diphosphate-sugar epimerase